MLRLPVCLYVGFTLGDVLSLDSSPSLMCSRLEPLMAFIVYSRNGDIQGWKASCLVSLLPDRKLKTLMQRPLNHIPENKDGYSLLLFWYWEECLKQRYERFIGALEEASRDMLPALKNKYERFIGALEEASRDMLPALKNKSLKTIFVLLSRKSEQERKLLTALVNKLGDPDNKAASNADYHLTNLLSQHPNMKAVVVNEVDTFLFRPHLSPRSQYHAVNFLSQIRLTNKGDGPKVAKRLIDVYFGLFKVLITGPSSNEKNDKHGKENPKEKNSEGHSDSHAEMDSRLLSVLLTGVNRAFPFVSSNEADDIVDVQTPVLFQLAEMFIALILRAMKRDVNLKRVAAFSKRLLQIALQQPPQYACACLFLLSELFKARPPLWNMALQNESLDDELEHFEDVIEETDKEPVIVSDKEPATLSDKPSDDIVPVQNGEVANSNKDSSDGEDDDDQPASSEEDDDDDDDQPASSEDDDDVDLDDALEDEDFSLAKSKNNHKKSKKSNTEIEGQKSQESIKKPLLPGGYDPRHREPSYCNADHVSWWELLVLASHAHPSVSTMARTLLSGANIVYNGNPLSDLSLTAFLDKFMEKKPKQSTWHGGSQIEPVKQLDVNNLLVGSEILALAEADVPPEDLVFHKFYTNKKSSSSKPKKKKKKSTDDEDVDDYFGADADDVDGGDESDNEEIEDLLDSADPTLGPDGDFDYDDLDKVANEDDDDLIGDDVSDADIDIDIPSDIELDDADDTPFADDDSDDNNDIQIGDMDDASDDVEDHQVDKRKRKRKTGGKGVSPFASYEEFEHILEDDDATEKKPSKDKNKSKRKKMEDDEPTEKKPSKDKNKSKKRKKKSAQ
ncbi:hypothetical protein TSUD_359080 [Trifolium subterraneum]|uniref:CCAAT-binding factor domain-containing protein n=1 Tax=Trifolium subterraneum TaxID=3900 RepID=A0A2Z6MHC9_TRISU|nr:hypothetical protein TSUD_359080 [Trifolium subterraneum]